MSTHRGPLHTPALDARVGSPRLGDGQAIEHESKFVFPADVATAIIDWLRARCSPDPEFSGGPISSIYYDGRDLRHLREKLDSDFFKTKFRLRWYGKPQASANPEPAFLEVKRKVGARRIKFRVATAEPAVELACRDLDDPYLTEILWQLRAAGCQVPMDLRPVFEIRFRRLRFVEPRTGVRIALDGDIRVPRGNLAQLPPPNPIPLRQIVLEVKGAKRELPAHLVPLCAWGGRKESFSKYARCYQHVVRRWS